MNWGILNILMLKRETWAWPITAKQKEAMKTEQKGNKDMLEEWKITRKLNLNSTEHSNIVFGKCIP